MSSRRTEFVSVNLTPAARDELRRAALEMSVPAGRRVSMSDALIGMARVASHHPGELIAAVGEEQG